MSDHRLAIIEGKLDTLVTGQAALETQQTELRHEMRVLHEDTIDKIKALAPDFGPIRREFTRADQDLREDIDRRLTPLEAFARTSGRTNP